MPSLNDHLRNMRKWSTGAMHEVPEQRHDGCAAPVQDQLHVGIEGLALRGTEFGPRGHHQVGELAVAPIRVGPCPVADTGEREHQVRRRVRVPVAERRPGPATVDGFTHELEVEPGLPGVPGKQDAGIDSVAERRGRRMDLDRLTAVSGLLQVVFRLVRIELPLRSIGIEELIEGRRQVIVRQRGMTAEDHVAFLLAINQVPPEIDVVERCHA